MSKKYEPWLSKGSIWDTESQYWSWIRGQIRRASSRYPVKNAFIRDNRFRSSFTTYKNGKPKEVWAGECAMCKERFPIGKLAVDHIIPAGSLSSAKDLEGFTTRMFCGYDNFQFLCKECHEIKSYADKYGITQQEAQYGIEASKVKKMSVKSQKRYLMDRGASEEDVSNKTKRDKLINKRFKITWLK